MNLELTKDELSFVVECVRMAEGEGFYLLDLYPYDFDIYETGKELLRKIGVEENDVKYCFSEKATREKEEL